MVSLDFLVALKVLIFHLTREEARVPNPIEPFLLSPCAESLFDWPNAAAAIDDLLDCEPRLDAGAAGMSELPGVGCVSDCPEVEGVGKFDAPPTDTRLEREAPAEGEGAENCDTDAVEDLRRLLASDCTIGNITRDSIVSERSWKTTSLHWIIMAHYC